MPPHTRVLLTGAWFGIIGSLCIMAVLIFWTVVPVTIPEIEEPLPILNPDNEIAVGEPIVLELNVFKEHQFLSADSNRYLRCSDGNLKLLVSDGRSTQLPVGEYTLINDNVSLPSGLTIGAVCEHVFDVTFDVNPIRSVQTAYVSEPFTVVER